MLEIYDTTLRDGSQGEGVNLSLADKLALTTALDWAGMAFIEGGWPGSNAKDEAYFAEVRSLPLTQAKITAFGSTRHVKNSPESDPNLQKLVSAKADIICIFGKTWDLHVTEALRVQLSDNLTMISTSVAYLAEASGRPVFYDAEHFFDGWKANPTYALNTVQAAFAAGAQRIILCDTNGGTLPHEISAGVAAVRGRLPTAKIGIHCHNDGGLAVANTLAAVQAGAMQVQGTINGIGERCGNVDLTTVIAACELKLGLRCLPDHYLTRLTELSRLVWERTNMVGPSNQPYVGKSAFAHKGGVHVSAVQRLSKTYEHVEPELIGNNRRVLISELSGRSNVQAKLASKYPQLADALLMKVILDEVVERENAGYSYEAAESSFELLVRQKLGIWQPSFTLHHYRIHGVDGGGPVEATVKVTVNGRTRLCAAEGDGPVDALSHALREALLPYFPCIQDLHLTDYKVRVVDSADGTAAKVRVLIEHQLHGQTISTIGVNENIIEASWQALVEGLEYALTLPPTTI